VGLRQLWKLGSNIYLLAYQPYLTLKNLKENRDKSQIFLLLLTALLPLILYVITRVAWDYYRFGKIIWALGPVFVGITGLEFLIWSFLSYWVFRVMRNGK
jgi:hypothetical protein